MDLYPLLFQSSYKEKVWGGRKLEELDRSLPPAQPIGETWDVVDGLDVVNGPMAGWSLEDMIDGLRHNLVGDRVYERYGSEFPLLVKIIDANDVLSIQVHPDDAAACRRGEDRGKTECWHVLHADPGSELIHGFDREITESELRAALRDNSVSELFHRMIVSPGDTVFVPARTVHAIGRGLLLYELQQRSDTTFRLHDWGRLGLDGKPRDLHVTEALDVVDYSVWPTHFQQPVPVPMEDGRSYLVACRHFVLERWDVSSRMQWETDGETFNLLTAVDGPIRIQYGFDGDEEVTLRRGQTTLIPADMGLFVLSAQGTAHVLRAYVPDLWADIVGPLIHAGIDVERIRQLGGHGAVNDLDALLSPRRTISAPPHPRMAPPPQSRCNNS